MSPRGKATFATVGIDLNRFATADSIRTEEAIEAQRQAQDDVCQKLNLDHLERKRKYKSLMTNESSIKNVKAESAKKKKDKRKAELWEAPMF